MSAVATRSPRQAGQAEPELFRFTVAQYLRLAGEYALGFEARTELIEGLVVRKMTRFAPHDGTLGRLNNWLAKLLSEEWVPRCQLGLVLARSVPEPDLAIVRGPEDQYVRRHPRAADTALVIEVAESTVQFDRDRKGPIYARARIPEYWIVNVPELQVEVYTEPRGGRGAGYQHRTDHANSDSVPLVLGGKLVAKLPVKKLFAGLAPA